MLRIDLAAPGAEDPQAQRQLRAEQAAASPGARMFANRLEKNLKRLDRLARRASVSCYRLYDADMPEYAFAVDRYMEAASGALHLHVQEYAPPASVEVQAAHRRRQEALATLPRVLDVPAERIHLRRVNRSAVRRSTNRCAATARGDAGGFVVEEGGLKFLVNLDDYLDTGLFLDHRLTRARLAARARGARAF